MHFSFDWPWRTSVRSWYVRLPWMDGCAWLVRLDIDSCTDTDICYPRHFPSWRQIHNSGITNKTTRRYGNPFTLIPNSHFWLIILETGQLYKITVDRVPLLPSRCSRAERYAFHGPFERRSSGRFPSWLHCVCRICRNRLPRWWIPYHHISFFSTVYTYVSKFSNHNRPVSVRPNINPYNGQSSKSATPGGLAS